MIYVYDIFLNFSNVLYEFYEWKKEEVEHYRKIGLFKISKDLMNDIFNKNVILEKEFLDLLTNKSENIVLERIIKTSNICLFTDGEEVLAVKFDNEALITEKSKLFISDEIEILELSSSLKPLILNYYSYGKYKHSNKLRIEEELDKKITHILESNYNEALINYLYLEWFREDKKSLPCLIEKVLKEDYFMKMNFLQMLLSTLKR